MNIYKSHFSIFLFVIICFVLGGLIYSEQSSAKNTNKDDSARGVSLTNPPSFIVGKYFGEGNEYGDFKTGDFNRDGKLDIAAVNSGNRISILLGNGDGSFNAPASFTTETNPGQIAIADFNNDNKLDIAVVISGASVVAIHLGNGNGTFGLSDIYTTANNPQALVAKEFTGDGNIDVATINASGSISMLRSLGDGSFAVAVNSTAVGGYGFIAAGDFDSDGDNDVIVSTGYPYSNGAYSYANNGNGSFSGEMVHDIGYGTGAIATGDFDGNGLTDVVSSPYGGNDLSILQQTGARTFTRRRFYLINRDLSYGAVVGDFNGDGKDDTALTNSRTNNLSVYLNNGTLGLFGVSTEYSIGAIGYNQGAGLGSGDFNNDGKIDLLAQKKGRFFLLMNRGDGTFKAPFSASTDYYFSNTNYIALGNFDSDSNIDMLTAASGGNNSLRGGGQGKFSYLNSFGLSNASGYRISRQLIPADFDNNGKADVLDVNDECTIFGCNGTSVTIHTGNGDGSFNVTNRSFTVGRQPLSAVVGDFSGDGKLDAVVASYFPGYFSNPIGSLTFLQGDGQGYFNPGINYVLDGGPAWIEKGDFNGDGKLDVVVARSTSNDVAVLLNNGGGTFGTPILFSVGTSPLFVSTKDLNGDGKLDLVVSNADSNNISVLFGNGDGSFGSATNFGGLSSPRSTTIADFNGDNILDIAAANGTGGFVSVLSGLGDGTFSAPTNIQTDVSMSTLAAYDFNGDGKMDLATATANENKSDAIIIINNGNFGTPQSCAMAPSGINAWLRAEGNAIDSVGNNNGILQNGATFSPGKVGQAFSFDGVDDYVALPDNLLPYPNGGANNPFSFETWFKTSTNGVILGEQAFAPFQTSIGAVPIIYVGTNGKLYSQMFWDGAVHPFASQTTVNDNNYHHVAISYDGTTERVYLDGNLFGSRLSSQVNYSSNFKYQLGTGYTGTAWEAAGGWLNFNGQIDEATLYNRSLTSTEIQSIFNAGSAGKCLNGILASLTLNPTSVNSGQTSTGTITLVNPAPSGGRAINLTSSDTNTATVPASITIAEGLTSGTFTVSTVAVTSDSPVTISAAYQGEIRTAILNVLAPKPDLQSVIVNAPAASNTDAAFDLSWTDRNNGSGAASGTWTDKVYISADNQIGNNTLLGNFPFTGTIAPNQSINRIQSISIPNSAIPTSGNYYLIVVTDANNDINEGNNENNNFSVRTINVSRTPFPDLTIQNITAPDTAFFGQTIRVQWTVKNIGDGPTNAAEWQDWYYISSDNVPEIEDPFKSPLTNISYLAAGESYTASADITIPQGLVGGYKILVWTDSDGTNHRTFPFSVIESDDSNNYNLARPIQINAPPLPDLQTTLVQVQEETFAGQSFNLNWRVENRGDGTTPPSLTAWNDKIYLSQNTTFEPSTDRLIGSRPHDGKLLATEGYSVNSFSITLPNDIAGNWYVFVVTDGDNQIFEFGNENNNSNYDRTQPGSPMLIRATPPDFIIPNAISAPNNATAAGQIAVSWTVKNQGAFDGAPNWFDTVYLSSDQTLNPADDTPLGTVARGNPLGAGLTYNAAANVTLPSCISGNYYLYVYADSRKQIFEYDPNFDAEANNYSQAKPITIIISPGDLRVTAVSNPVSGVAGQPTVISWTVANQGTGITLNTVWNDEVYLSPTANFVKTNSTSIGAFTHTGALAVGGSYSQTQNIVIPNTTQGNYYVFVLTDANDNVEECGSANSNNVGGGSTVFNVSNSLPDLTVGNFAFANNLFGGQNVNVTWTVTNSGNTAAQNSSWNDTVYFSTNATLDADDRILTDVITNSPLNVGASYTKSAALTLPIVSPGSYYLILKTDNGNFVFEGLGENNNTRNLALPITAPPVDLLATAVNAPATTNAGQTMTVNWTVANNGTDQTIGSQWTDAVVLSLDQIDDPTDRVIGYAQHDGILNGGASYNATTDVFVPSGLAGQYYIFIRADRNNQLAESNENNNSSGARAVSLQLAPPSDLIVTSVTQPANASPGENATFNWTVLNTGANPATGLWTDTVYLSSDQTWDIGDVLVGRYTAGVNVAPGQSYNGTLTTTLPAVNLGYYYVIIRTDIRNRVIETNENNNSSASGGTTTVDVPLLQLGVPQSTTLITGQERFYKFNAPASETVRVSLDGQDGSSNEFYTRFGQMASRNAYDFLFDRLYEPDQQLLIPNTNAGNYYNMIRGENVPNSLANNEVKQAGKINTKPIDSKQTIAAENVTVKAEIIPFSITSVSPNRIGDNGQVTITLKGAKFAEGATVKLVQGNTVLNAAKVILIDSTTVKARFYFTNATRGFYDIYLNQKDESAIKLSALEVAPKTSGMPEIILNSNSQPRIGRKDVSYAFLQNNSNTDFEFVEVRVLAGKIVNMEVTIIPNLVLPNNEPQSMSGRIFGTEMDETTRAAFFLRNIAPGESVPFTIEMSNITAGKFKFKVEALARTIPTEINQIRLEVEQNRQLILRENLPVHPELNPFLFDSEAFWQKTLTGLVETRLFSNDEVSLTNYYLSRQDLNLSPLIIDPTSPCQCKDPNNYTKTCASKGPFLYAACVMFENVKCLLQDSDECDCKPGDKDCKDPANPNDPNEKVGPIGFGTEKFVGSKSPLAYVVNFENVPTATASAQRVHVTDQLDPNVDPRTFRLKEIGFGSYRLQVPENRAFFQQRVQLGAEFNNILADISAGVDISTGKVTWTLTAIDPATGEQPNSANLGLLAPNDETGRGQGFVTYTVQPKQTAPTGTVIRNNATIIFDTEEPITTNTVTNTLDADIPTSAVNALPPTQANTTFTVSWSGQDAANGSGLQNYDVWVAENDGAYQPFVSGTTKTSAAFTGAAGKTYKFYSIARDNAGNVEAAPAVPDATTMTLTSQSYEGDVLSRPNGDGFVDSDDVQQIRRFSLGLDTAGTGSEFQRADCSPRSSLGEGFIDSGDIQQARRYSVGIDANQFAGGPSTPSPIAPPVSDAAVKGKAVVRAKDGAAAFRIDNQNTSAGSTLTVPIRVDTVGNEAGYTFSIAYDSTKLTNPQVAIGSGGGDVIFNANNPGQIGFSVTSFSGGTIAAGNNIALVNVTFTVAATAEAGTTPISFTDTITKRMVSPVDPNNPITQPTYTGGTVTIGEAAAVSAVISGRVMTTNGRGIANVIVTLTDANGSTRTAATTTFGYYRFTNVPAGATYIINAAAKRYKFGQPTRVLNLSADNNEVDFIAIE